MRNPRFRASFAFPGELVVDNFAGGGGASTGIEEAIGRPVDIAINHDPLAIAMHKANHPETKHYCENIWEVDPVEACAGRPVGLAWFSPDCTHFSRAKGAQPRRQEIRGLAWVVIRWAKTVRPRIILLENVEEFQTWGPLGEDGRPVPDRMGETFRGWLAELQACGYSIEFKSLIAADYGAPTTRKRLFLIARRDNAPIIWPAATHGAGRPAPYRTAAEVIDWSLACPSIFSRKRPLKDATLRRIAAGIKRYVLDAAQPFIIPVTHPRDARIHGVGEPFRTITAANRGELAIVAPIISKHYGGVVGHSVTRPLGTITTQDHHSVTAALLVKNNLGSKPCSGLTTAFLTKFFGTSIGADLRRPLPTITAGGHHLAEVRALLIKYYGEGGVTQDVQEPLHTVTTKARFGLVTIHGEDYQIADIGMRMLQPHELFAANGFPEDYIIRPEHNGKPLSKTAQTALAGNAVCPPNARALVQAVLSSPALELAA